MMKNTWTIVKFHNENAVEAVPTGWLLGNGECFWPPWTLEKLTTAIKKSEEPNTCWPSFKVDIFRNSTYEDYWLARSKARKAEETSDLNSESDQPQKRIRKRKKLSSSESENEELQYIRSPPRLKKNISEIGTTPKSQEAGYPPKTPNLSLFHGKQCPDQPSSIISSKSTPLSIVTDELTPTTSRIRTAHVETNSDVRQSEFTTDHCTCCRVHNNGKYLKELLQLNHLLRTLIGDLTLDVRAIKETYRENTDVIESFFNKFKFPLQLAEDFEAFENYLKDTKLFGNAVTEMSKLGGRNPYEFIKRTMNLLMSNELASSYSWLGRKEKSSFHLTQMAKLLVGAADEGKISSSHKQTEQAIGSWLKRAKERIKKK